jgi:hypothetical protein
VRKMTLRPQAYSSVVGGGLQVVDKSGAVRFLICMIGTTEGITREETEAISSQIIAALKDRELLIPHRNTPGMG